MVGYSQDISSRAAAMDELTPAEWRDDSDHSWQDKGVGLLNPLQKSTFLKMAAALPVFWSAARLVEWNRDEGVAFCHRHDRPQAGGKEAARGEQRLPMPRWSSHT